MVVKDILLSGDPRLYKSVCWKKKAARLSSFLRRYYLNDIFQFFKYEILIKISHRR